MKKLFAYTSMALVAIMATSCDLTLIPEDKVSPEAYFHTETDLMMWTNQFYDIFEDPATLYAMNADDMVDKSMGSIISGTRLPSDKMNGTNEWNWNKLRSINYYFENSTRCPDEAARARYDGVAYFFRAYVYFEKVKRFGDVPWYDKVIGSEDTEMLNRPRDSRQFIMKKVMEDLDSAIVRLPATKSLSEVTKWTALALKSRAALFEGTWEKYHGMGDGAEFLTLAADASRIFIEQSGYSLYSTGTNPYRTLFSRENSATDEVVLAVLYNFAGLNLSHSVYFNIVNNAQGFTRRFMNHYLMADGSRFTDIPGHETMWIADEVAGRDPRLAQTVLTPGFIQDGEKSPMDNNFESFTGYMPIKWVTDQAHSGSAKGTSDLILFRAAEVYLNYAEALAELGSITQADLDMSVCKIRKRAGMPDLDISVANNNVDPFLVACYPNVTNSTNKGVILEIRRERTVELVNEGFRQWDMLRWKEGAQMVNQTNPYYGVWVPGAGLYDTNGDGKNDLEIYIDKRTSVGLNARKINADDFVLSEGDHGYIVAWSKLVYNWNEERDYLYPVPVDQRILTGGALTQNPGWSDGADL